MIKFKNLKRTTTTIMVSTVPRHIPNSEKIVDTSFPTSSPVEDPSGNLAVTSLNGDVYTLNQDNNLELTYSTGGQPSAIVFDMEGSSFVADLAHQAILSATMIDGHLDISQMVRC